MIQYINNENNFENIDQIASIYEYISSEKMYKDLLEYKKDDNNLKEIVDQLKLMTKDVPSGAWLRPWIIDPKSGLKRDYNKKSLIDHYAEYGIFFQPGQINLDAGIYKVNTIKFKNITSSKYKPLTEKDMINPANKGKECNIDAEIHIYADSDFAYYYKFTGSELECLSKNTGVISNLPKGCNLSEGCVIQ